MKHPFPLAMAVLGGIVLIAIHPATPTALGVAFALTILVWRHR